MTKQQRHDCMSAIKSKDTKPEMLVRKYLFSRGLRFRVQVAKLPGKPDIVLPKYKTVVFVNGCFWHGHEECRYYRLPKSNVEFWQKKIERNIERDARAECELKAMGWRVIRIWECEIRKVSNRRQSLETLYEHIVHETQRHSYDMMSDDLSIAAEPENQQNYGSINKY